MQRIGIIDLGSNTTRLIVMAYEPGRAFKLVDEVSEAVRLAEGVGKSNRLQPQPMRRAVEALAMFASFCKATGVSEVIAVGTSAIREAVNHAEFFAALRAATDLELRILTGDEEAFYGYLGAVNSLQFANGYVFDTGGGSTQVMAVRDRQLLRSVSRQAGVLRFTERYIKSDPINKRDLRNLQDGAQAIFTDLDLSPISNTDLLVGMGGTVRTLARIAMKRSNYPIDRLHGYLLERTSIDETIELLIPRTRREREQIPGLKSDRADVTLAGAIIIRQLMELGQFSQLTVSGSGLREGLFYHHFLRERGETLFADHRSLSVRSLARFAHYEAEHAERVAHLSLQLFDQMAPFHHYGAWERELLHHAAILHDIGVLVGYYDHHKHSAYLVLNSGLLGFSHREIAILAYLVRNHRKGQASISEFSAVLADDDAQRILRLSACLRLAEYLERSKSGAVRSVQVSGEADRLVIAIETHGDASVEIWETSKRLGFFEKAFAVNAEIQIDSSTQ